MKPDLGRSSFKAASRSSVAEPNVMRRWAYVASDYLRGGNGPLARFLLSRRPEDCCFDTPCSRLSLAPRSLDIKSTGRGTIIAPACEPETLRREVVKSRWVLEYIQSTRREQNQSSASGLDLGCYNRFNHRTGDRMNLSLTINQSLNVNSTYYYD